MPFITISDSQIKLSHSPNGIVQEQLWLYEEECTLDLLKIEYNLLRLVINQQDQRCYIDLQFDQPSMDLLFESVNYNEFERDCILDIVRALSEEPHSNKKNAYHAHSYAIKSQSKLSQFLQGIKSAIESNFTELFNIQDFNQLCSLLNGNEVQMPSGNYSNIHMCVVKVTDLTQQFQFVFITENEKDKSFEVLIQNCYETHGILQLQLAPHGKKVKAQGYEQFDYLKVSKLLGLDVSVLDNSDIQLLCYVLSHLFDLHVFVKELDTDDYERYRENCIIQNTLTSESCYRFYVGKIFYILANEYRIPVTISYVGIQDNPIGILVQVFDDENIIQSGMFLTISSGIWERVKKESVQVWIDLLQEKRKTSKIYCNEQDEQRFFDNIYFREGGMVSHF
ncbi:hypothetical protein FGO68_gene6887 [Halteria grandinella]|uniref:Uncharacterized protein n=1 Tax=Halteria grandinella TaxID=5974 RepID=A0A8J8NGZ5_HALGN|nr:hypothetical protein FGO68_gene6887 [Halteria grandinella]